MTRPIIIIGAGGHAGVVADALLATGACVLGFTDADPSLHGRHLCGLPVLGDDRVLAQYSADTTQLANGLGGVGRGIGASLRRRVQESLVVHGWEFASVRHPAAIVSASARVAAGVQLFAACVVQPGARIGAGCIVNTAAVIEHDGELGEFTHVAPRALLCGDVTVGADCHIGAGAVVRERVHLGAATVVGAGAVVLHDFPGSGTLVGVPALPLERRQ